MWTVPFLEELEKFNFFINVSKIMPLAVNCMICNVLVIIKLCFEGLRNVSRRDQCKFFLYP